MSVRKKDHHYNACYMAFTFKLKRIISREEALTVVLFKVCRKLRSFWLTIQFT